MAPISLRLTLSLSLLAVIGWPASIARANHHHIGGSGSGGDDKDADCVSWGYLVVDGGGADRNDGANTADADGAVSDAGNGPDASQPAPAATWDAGSAAPAGAVLVCLEHATLFGCDCATVPAAGQGWSCGAVAWVAALLIASRRRRRGG